MAKAPIAGQVKTRLLPALTAEGAADLAYALLVDQLDHLCGLDVADLYLAFTPEEARPQMAGLAPVNCGLFPQQGSELGQRMNRTFERLHDSGYREVVLIGGDIAPVPVHFVAAAYSFLDGANHRVVLGPGRDGGYYLVGMNRLTPQIFTDMTWSHQQVLEQTLTRLDLLRIETQLLPVWFDVDTPDDLVFLRANLESELEATMKNTSSLLRRLGMPGMNPKVS